MLIVAIAIGQDLNGFPAAFHFWPFHGIYVGARPKEKSDFLEIVYGSENERPYYAIVGVEEFFSLVHEFPLIVLWKGDVLYLNNSSSSHQQHTITKAYDFLDAIKKFYVIPTRIEV